MSQTWDEHAPQHKATRRHFDELDFSLDPRTRLLAKFGEALTVIKTQPEKCHGGPEYVRDLRNMLEWAIGVIECDVHNQQVDEICQALIGKRLKDLK
ncbi:MAG TPA: hypothetical protein VFQ79_24585 [Bryobacteraceae bacterium]|nr:hypothetical protein [Bryobacteraceae bacterium]